MNEYVKEYPGLSFTVRYKPNGDHVLEFVSYKIRGRNDDGKPFYERDDDEPSVNHTESLSDAQPFCSGFVKWDGCSNVQFDEQEKVMLHFCDRREAGDVGRLLEAVYDQAGNTIPAWSE